MSERVSLAVPTPQQMAWQDMELGLFIHWFPMGWYQEIDEARVMDKAYQKELLARCTCENLDTDQWVQSALDLGAKYLMFVAKHALGFCAWQTDAGDFGMKQIPYQNGRGDVVRDLAASCKKAGIRLGIYLAADTMVMNVAQAGIVRDPAFQEEYDRIYRQWLTELLSRYGDVVEVWFDGSLNIDVADILRRYAPRAMVFQSRFATIRWVGQEEGYASDPAWNAVRFEDAKTGVATQRQGTPHGDVWLPLECDARLRADWGYHENLAENPLRSLDELMGMYYNSVGHGAVLLINQAPHPKGHIIKEDMARMKEFGEEIKRRFDKPVLEGKGKGSIVELSLEPGVVFDHIILMEDIKKGERVREYRVEAQTGGVWQVLSTGSAIGHKKIDYFEPVSPEKVRLVVVNSVGQPLLKKIALYNVGKRPAPFVKNLPGEQLVGDFGTELYDRKCLKARFSYPLDRFITQAGQYLITFRLHEDSHQNLGIEEAWLTINDIRQEAYLTPGEEPHSYHLNIGGLYGRMGFHALSKLDGMHGVRGEVYIKRLA